MYTYTFSNGDVVKSNLSQDLLMQRMRRLDTLRVLTEGYEYGVGLSIYNKALKAYNKTDNFTGLIRLNPIEKDFLSCILEDNEMLTSEDRECLEYYL